jgi:hypothetical protein
MAKRTDPPRKQANSVLKIHQSHDKFLGNAVQNSKSPWVVGREDEIVAN